MTSYQQPPPPPGYPPQQAAPAGYPPQQPAPGYPPQQPAPGYPPQQAAPPQQQMAPGGMPQFHQADEAATAAALQQSTVSQGGAGGPFPTYIKVPGPRGETNWKDVHAGYEGAIIIRICPPWAAGKPVFMETKTHFYKSVQNPKGKVIGFTGEDGLYMQAIQMAMQSPDPRLQSIATNYGRVRRQFLWNCLDLSNPAIHYGDDGIMRPCLLAAGAQLQGDLKRLIEVRGGVNAIIHPQSGRPMRMTKKKTGAEERNVEYGVMDLDPAPLDPYFYPALQNLWDLEAQVKVPTHEEIVGVIQELGLPMPATGQAFGQVPASYNAAPMPPHENPYQQQAPAQPMPGQAPMPAQQPGPAPAGAVPAGAPPPPVPGAGGMPGAQPAPMPPDMGGYPPQQPQGYPPQQPQGYPPQPGMAPGGAPPPPAAPAGPPPMQPPPVQSQPAAAGAYPPPQAGAVPGQQPPPPPQGQGGGGAPF